MIPLGKATGNLFSNAAKTVLQWQAMKARARKSRGLIAMGGGGPVGRSLSRLAMLAVLAAAYGQDRPANVVIIGIDSLRPDHLGCQGYVLSTSSNIDKK
jgi:hypothetical protein